MKSYAIGVARRLLRPRSAAFKEVFAALNSTIVGDVTVRVEEYDGVFRLSPKSDLFRRLLKNSCYEPEIKRVFLQHLDADRDIIDIGANVGFFSVLAAKSSKNSRVLAVEPTPGAHRRLVENIELNGLSDRISVFNGAVSDSAGNLTLYTIQDREEYSSLAPITHPATALDVEEKVVVEVTTLDDLVSTHKLRPGLIKVDVEGAEGLVFAGAEETVREHRPVIISELSEDLLRSFGTTTQQVIKRIEGWGYSVSSLTASRSAFSQDHYGEILCVPLGGRRV